MHIWVRKAWQSIPTFVTVIGNISSSLAFCIARHIDSYECYSQTKLFVFVVITVLVIIVILHFVALQTLLSLIFFYLSGFIACYDGLLVHLRPRYARKAFVICCVWSVLLEPAFHWPVTFPMFRPLLRPPPPFPFHLKPLRSLPNIRPCFFLFPLSLDLPPYQPLYAVIAMPIQLGGSSGMDRS